MRILEKQLADVIKKFENKDIVVELKNTLEAKFKMNNIKISYDYEAGFLHITDDKDNKIDVNYTSVYNTQISQNILKLKLDNLQEITIIKN